MTPTGKRWQASMSRDYRDQRGGYQSKYWGPNSGIADFKRQCRRSARYKAKQALRQGHEPPPQYPIETEYWD